MFTTIRRRIEGGGGVATAPQADITIFYLFWGRAEFRNLGGMSQGCPQDVKSQDRDKTYFGDGQNLGI